MALTIDNSARQAALNGITALLAGGDFQLLATSTELAIAVPDLGRRVRQRILGQPVDCGVDAIGSDTSGDAGTINTFRLRNAGGTSIITGTVGTSGADLNVTDNVIPSGATSVSCPVA